MSAKKKKKEQPLVSLKNQTNSATKSESKQHYFLLALIVLISFIVYLPVFHSGFVWDDILYIQNNPLIQTVNLKQIFSQFVQGYEPLTILVFAIEYHFFGLNTEVYHAVNLLFHLLNVILVFRVVSLISNKPHVALIASLLFGIHPMHVESVAWACELKDVLYVFFLLAAYIYYLKYINLLNRNKYEFTNKADPIHNSYIRNKFVIRRYYFYCLLLFLLSVLAKAMAVSFPLLLILTDYFKERKINRSTLIEKAPFFALSLIFGVVAVFAQQSAGAINLVYFTLPQRIVFASYGFITYLIKLLLPLHLCAYYPYPIKNGDSIPFQYYVYLFLPFGLAACVWYSLRFTKKILFGIGFFTITVFLVLQLLPAGDAIVSDRFSYLASIGIFYLAGESILFLWNKKGANRNLRIPAMLLFAIALVFYSIKTYSQCKIWKNGLSLWNDVISQYKTIPSAYNNRGVVWESEKRYDEAISDFNKALALQPEYFNALNNRGFVFENENIYDKALNDYNRAIQIKPDYVKAYTNRKSVLTKLKRYDEALRDLNKIIELHPDDAEAYNDRGYFMENQKRYKEAIDNFNKAIALNPDYVDAYINKGVVLSELQNYDEALNCFNKTIELSPDLADAYYNRGCFWEAQKRYEEALNDFNKAVQLQPYNPAALLNLAEIHLNLGISYKEKKDTVNAVKQFDLAGKFMSDSLNVTFYTLLGDNYHDVKNVAEADKYYDKVLEIDPRNANVLNNYSCYLSMRGEKLDKAEAMSKLANDIAPRQPLYEDTYCWILYKERKYPEAIKSFKKALSDGGDTIGIVLEHYGDVLYKTGDTTQALEYWNKAKAKGSGITDLLDKKIAEKKLVE